MRKLFYSGFVILAFGCGQSEAPTPQVPIPAIIDFDPKTGVPGTSVTITGSNFGITAIENTVKFNGVATIVTSCTATSIVALVPNGEINGPISVAVNNQMATSTDEFVGYPKITGFFPQKGPAGTLVTISGYNFSTTPSDNVVTFNGLPAIVTTSGLGYVKATVPAGDFEGVISVSVAGNSSTTSQTFTHACQLTTVDTNNTFGSRVITYEYNNQNQIVRATTTGSGAAVTTYTYNTMGLISTSVRTAGPSTTTSTYAYDAQGRVVSVTSGGVLNNYIYNSTNQLVRIQNAPSIYTEYVYPNPTTFNYSSETIVSGASTTVTLYEYDDKRNPSRDNFPLNFLPENNWSKQTQGSLVVTLTYTYNSYGYPETATWSGGATGTTTYAYHCD